MIRPPDPNLRSSDMNLFIPFPKTDYLKNGLAIVELNYEIDCLVKLKMLERIVHFNAFLLATSLVESHSSFIILSILFYNC